MTETNIRGRRGWILIENEGALFRGPGRGNPVEVWFSPQGWTAYEGGPKPVEWGNIVDEDEAGALMKEISQRLSRAP